MATRKTHLELKTAMRFIRELLAEQSRYTIERWMSAATVVDYKDRRDMATSVDIKLEERIKSGLREEFPDHGLTGEETDAVNENAEYQWLIDPIDGTKWYVAQAHLFSISVALFRNQVPVLGAVQVPSSGQCFHAFHGSGAYLDEVPISGSSVRELRSAIVSVDAPKTDRLADDERAWFERKLIQLTRRAYRVRMLGAGALSGCWVSTGALDAFVDLTGYNKPQDVGAARIIMSEAGIKVEYITAPTGPKRLLAAPTALWEELRGLLDD
ncbi:inositol monophosphatase family protein [Candidatus Poribacteria bacterium]|nr:inositol monophosphatase family protein [Candidatus Poribacteria bacterium]